MPPSQETPTSDSRGPAPSTRLRRRLFPGDPRVWRVGLVLGALLAGVVVWQTALVEREYFTGTNSVVPRGVVTTVLPGEPLCLDRLDVPPDTGRVRFEVRPLGRGARLRLRLTTGGRQAHGVSRHLATGRQTVDIPVAPPDADGESAEGALCLRAIGGAVSFLGVAELQSDAFSPTLNGLDINSMVALWYLPPAGMERTFVESLPDIIHRAGAVFRPAPIGAWTYVLVLLLLPGLAYAALRVLARTAAGGRAKVPVALAVAAIGFLHAAGWSVITPVFDAPDEMNHYAYTQSLAETGNALCQSCGKEIRSTEELHAVDAAGILGYTEDPMGRPPWLAVEEQRLDRQELELGAARDDGGGTTTAASHAPPYYGALVPAYLAADAFGADVFGRLAAMRLFSALLAAITAAFVFLTVRELLPAAPVGAAAAGLLVALQPMVGFIGGSVNNDNGINATLALVAFTLVRILQSGLTVRRGIALGALLVLAPLVKSTGYAAYPPALLTLGFVAYRQHTRRDLPAWLGLAGATLALSVVWALLSPVFDRSVYGTPDGGAPGSQPSLAGTGRHPLSYVSYVWQVFLPRLPFMSDLHLQAWPAYDIYVERGFAAFGWYAITFPTWVYVLILAGMLAVGLLAAWALARHRGVGRRLLAPTAVLALLGLTVVCGVHASFFSIAGDRPVVSEQGRYIFTALAPLGAIAAAACHGLGRRWVPVVASVLVVSMAGLAYASQLLGLMSFYS